MRLIKTITLCSALLTASVLAHDPLDRQGLPEWAVLVVQLISRTHVVPTTGIVVSSSGQVLVTQEFAEADYEIVVLDGGMDVVSYGRPARLQSVLPGTGMAILQVDYLSRKPVTLAADSLADNSPALLLGWPPADQIEAGASHVTQITKIAAVGDSGLRMDQEFLLSNINGALVDGCDNLLAVSLAKGLPSMATDVRPAYLGLDRLATALGQAGITLQGRSCNHSMDDGFPTNESLVAALFPEAEDRLEDSTKDEPGQEPGAAPPAAVEEPLSVVPVLEPVPEAADAAVPDSAGATDEAPGPLNDYPDESPVEQPAFTELREEPPSAEPAVQAAEPADTGPAMDSNPVPGETNEPAGAASLPYWVYLLTGLVVSLLMVLVVKRRKPGKAGSQEESPVPGVPVLKLVDRKGNAGEQDEWLIVAFSGIVDLTVGRGGCDLELTNESVSRRHARLAGTPRSLRLEDLGSTNGTRVNDVHCPPGKVVTVVPGDEISLGQVVLVLSTIRSQGDSL